jgi:hypothetical protein
MKRTTLQLVLALSILGSVRADQTIQSVQQVFQRGKVESEVEEASPGR